MRHLFDYSHALAAAGYPWAEHPPSLDPREIVVHMPTPPAKAPQLPESLGKRALARLRDWWARQ
jgi:hypothetical protein